MTAACVWTCLKAVSQQTAPTLPFQRLRQRPLWACKGRHLQSRYGYTPFTAYLLSGAWAWSLTTSLWLLTGLGIAGKIFLPPISQKIWVPMYLGLAWIGAIAAIPLANMTSGVVLWLLALGGVFYSAGILFYTNKRLQFAKAIWHGHVVAAAATHWVAVLVGLFMVRS